MEGGRKLKEVVIPRKSFFLLKVIVQTNSISGNQYIILSAGVRLSSFEDKVQDKPNKLIQICTSRQKA